MKHIHAFQVFPKLPGSLNFLGVLSRNMWWSWKPDAIELFRRVDPRLWEASGRNPIVFATQVSQQRLQKLAADDSFLAHLDRVRQQFKERVLASPDLVENPYSGGARIAYFSMEFGIHESLPLFAGGLGVLASPDLAENPYSGGARIAYFSMEFGIHESLPLFAGGLGVLAGDHLKSASHMGLPMVAVGLLYRQGYFRQLLDPNGWQQETYPETDIYTLPLTRVKNGNGDLRISVPHPDGEMLADVWKIMIGRVPLILLDTNVVENPPAIREVTARLYNSEPGVRLAQEVLLGIGGMRALTAMGIEPTICHMNEGHSAFANVERLIHVMERHQLDIPTAMEVVARTSVFTTHTPVPAGHDEFPLDQVHPYIKPLAKQLRVNEEEVLSWGCTGNSSTPHGPFSMLILGLRFSQHCNGVSRLHGHVARRMWRHVWPGHNDSDVPITHVTNGVHVSSFIAPEVVMLFERYLGPEWHYSSRKPENIERIDEIYDEELWRAHEMSRTRLISKVRELLVSQYARRNAPIAVVRAAENALDPERLTIGFSRRFTTYKRANLILRDPERLKAMLVDKERPVQILFAGKAHPQDNEGKDLIRNIVQFAKHHDVRSQIVFIEDYDMGIARYLVQGVDVWLNTPRRPLEACGTSGMKAAMNGALNLSILDGWWDEGYTPERGWRIGSGAEYPDPAYQDAVEAQALYNVLENDVIPCFYNRTSGNMPAEWLAKMKASMKMAMAQFCSHRMVNEYQQRFYVPGVQRHRELLADNAAEARRLSVLHQRLKSLWQDVRVEMPERDHEGPFQVEDSFTVSTLVHLGALNPEEVDVELYYGRMQRTNDLEKGLTQPMEVVQTRDGGTYLYRCTVRCEDSGRYGFTVRVVPRADDWIRFSPGLLTWA